MGCLPFVSLIPTLCNGPGCSFLLLSDDVAKLWRARGPYPSSAELASRERDTESIARENSSAVADLGDQGGHAGDSASEDGDEDSNDDDGPIHLVSQQVGCIVS